MTPADLFRSLHVRGSPFVLANAWDAGSARILAALGAKAIATSSAAHAFTLGLPDGGHVTRDVAVAHGRDLVEATGLPVSGDFEHGYGPTPEDCVATVQAAAAAGLAGVSIEDTDLPGTAPYPFDAAVARIAAAAEAARESGIVLTARADGLMLKTYDLDEAIRRLQAFEAAGADCLYAPLPARIEDVATICDAVDAPVNVLAAGRFARVPLAEWARMGVARVSLGSALARVTHAALLENARKVLDGTFAGLTAGAAGGEVDRLLREGAAR